MAHLGILEMANIFYYIGKALRCSFLCFCIKEKRASKAGGSKKLQKSQEFTCNIYCYVFNNNYQQNQKLDDKTEFRSYIFR